MCLFVVLLRSRHSFSIRPFHSGICIYIACFSPYALIKVVAIVKLLEAHTQQDQLTAGLLLNGSFMLFFWLGFGGKMALMQLWMHLITRHTSGDGEVPLLTSATQTWTMMRRTVVGVCLLYSIGFVVLVGVYSRASNECAATADACIPFSYGDMPPPPCLRMVVMAQGVVYYEGTFAAAVAVVFTFYALMFNGLVYAMLTSDATFSNLTKLQVLPQLPIFTPHKTKYHQLHPLAFTPQKPTYFLQPHQAAAHADFERGSPAAAATVSARMCPHRFLRVALLQGRASSRTTFSGSFLHHGVPRHIKRRATWSSGAPACAPLASSSPSSACAASRARPCWWRCSYSASCLMAAPCT